MAFKAITSKIRDYYWLSKPGIIYANILTAAAGFCLAVRPWRYPVAGSTLLIGLSLVIAGACAYNNYLDRGLDVRMARTKKRALVTGRISAAHALIYATVTSVLGLVLLAATQNRITTILAAVALFDYVVVYGISKRKSPHGTLLGCISGSIPLMAGYTAGTNHVGVAAWLLFAVMVTWQMAHFYGIALYRLGDYKAAGIPVMPAVHGTTSTKQQTLGYMVLFALGVVALGTTHTVGWPSVGLVLLLAVVWLAKAVRNYPKLTAELWGKQVFLFSLLVICGFSLLLAVGSWQL